MYFITETLCGRGLALLKDDFASHLCMFAGVAYDGGSVVNEVNPFDSMVANESANGISRDVTKAAVESVYVDTFDWGYDGCGIGVFNSEQAMLV